MVNDVVLLHDGLEVARGTVRINHPLLHDGLVILATSFDQHLAGFRCFLPGVGLVDLVPGRRIALPNGGTLGVLSVLADARRTADGRVFPGGAQLGSPALQLSLLSRDGSVWQDWYFLREPPPAALAVAGAVPQPVEPLAGGCCLTVGVLLAALSYYRKRAHGDRPQL